ncbi:unnamed protein product [Closterium sp. Naga37s-1]|nr:unnamed protein product [Closterium sp. Naga37s-1]
MLLSVIQVSFTQLSILCLAAFIPLVAGGSSNCQYECAGYGSACYNACQDCIVTTPSGCTTYYSAYSGCYYGCGWRWTWWGSLIVTLVILLFSVGIGACVYHSMRKRRMQREQEMAVWASQQGQQYQQSGGGPESVPGYPVTGVPPGGYPYPPPPPGGYPPPPPGGYPPPPPGGYPPPPPGGYPQQPAGGSCAPPSSSAPSV